MIATHHGPGDRRGDRYEQARASVIDAVDAVVGPPPQRLGGPTAAGTGRPPHLAVGPLAVRALLWGVVLGALAPATTALVLVSGVAADGVSLVGSTDLAFFFGFVPLLTGIVAVLLSANHWPLRSLTAYHRELSLGLLGVGAVLLVELRAHGAEVTGDDWDEAWLFVNGSLVLHVLATWWLVRVASDSLTKLHARRTGWPRAPRPGPGPAAAALAWDPPRRTATLTLALRSFLWGLAIAAATGAAAGTVVLPVAGTVAGAYIGAIYGLVPTVAGTAVLVTVVSWRRDTDPVAVERSVQATLAALGAVVLAAAWPFLHTVALPAGSFPEGLRNADPLRAWLAVAPVVVLLLRQAAPHLAATYVRLVPQA